MVLFGTSKLTGIGKSLGGAIRDFRSSVKSDTPEDKPAEDESKETDNSND
jgi:TatA/E family protein of Tat protein translocase